MMQLHRAVILCPGLWIACGPASAQPPIPPASSPGQGYFRSAPLPLLAPPASSPEFVEQAHQWGVKLVRAAFFEELNSAYKNLSVMTARNAQGQIPSERFFSGFAAPTGSQDAQFVGRMLTRWVELAPESAAAATARATFLLQQASERETQRDWKGADAALEEAERVLAGTQEAGRTDGNWHAATLEVARRRGWIERRVGDALRFAAANTRIWPERLTQATVRVLLPDWKERVEPIVWLANAAVERTEQREGTALYARIYLEAAKHSYHVRVDPFGNGQVNWPQMNAAMSDLHRQNGDKAILNQHAALACLANDRNTTAALLGRIGPDLLPDRWRFWGGGPHLERCTQWARAGSLGS